MLSVSDFPTIPWYLCREAIQQASSRNFLGETEVSAPSFRVHVSIFWLQQYCPTCVQIENVSCIFSKCSIDIAVESVFSTAGSNQVLVM